MPPTLTYPGVYIYEPPSTVHTITGVATSIAAFVGYTALGRDNKAVQVFSFADFERSFGGLATDSELSYAVQQFFANGGGNAYVVRVPRNGATSSNVVLQDGSGHPSLKITALNTGDAGNGVLLDIDYAGTADDKSFNLTVTDEASGNVETFPNVSMDKTQTGYFASAVNDEDNGSQYIRAQLPDSAATANRPAQTGTSGADLTFQSGVLQGLDSSKAYSLQMTIAFPASAARLRAGSPASRLSPALPSPPRLLRRR